MDVTSWRPVIGAHVHSLKETWLSGILLQSTFMDGTVAKCFFKFNVLISKVSSCNIFIIIIIIITIIIILTLQSLCLSLSSAFTVVKVSILVIIID